MRIAESVMQEIGQQEYTQNFAQKAEKVCLKYDGCMLYKGEELSSGDFVWRVFRFTDGSLLYLDAGGMWIHDDEGRILEGMRVGLSTSDCGAIKVNVLSTLSEECHAGQD
jgi:hypothetical protein